MGGTRSGANVATLAFPFGATVAGTATSEFFDTGYGAPDYAPAAIVDGYRFIRFCITLAYPGTPIPGAGETLPSVQSISIGYAAPINCP